jgi:hypothetical protein
VASLPPPLLLLLLLLQGSVGLEPGGELDAHFSVYKTSNQQLHASKQLLQ